MLISTLTLALRSVWLNSFNPSTGLMLISTSLEARALAIFQSFNPSTGLMLISTRDRLPAGEQRDGVSIPRLG